MGGQIADALAVARAKTNPELASFRASQPLLKLRSGISQRQAG